MLLRMLYAEVPPPPALDGLVKAYWTLDCAGDANQWINREATPDGCVEIVHRLSGRSIWGEAQPERFVAGLIDRPAALRLSGDARFSGVRLWPWAWNALGLQRCSAFVDRWIPLTSPIDVELGLTRFGDRDFGRAILAARSVDHMTALTGRSHRWLQRWFAREIGVPPRHYLRLLRFQDALATVQSDAAPLAAHAADHGFADQAHMAREFRALAGAPGSAVRGKAQGPFV